MPLLWRVEWDTSERVQAMSDKKIQVPVGVPEEIKNLQGIHLASVRSQQELDRLVMSLTVEVFRRGQRAGSK